MPRRLLCGPVCGVMPSACHTWLCLQVVRSMSSNASGAHVALHEHSNNCIQLWQLISPVSNIEGNMEFCPQVVSSMSSKARAATVALHGQVDKRAASEQLSLLVSDLVASANGEWAALALHQRVELFNLKSSKHHGTLPVFEVHTNHPVPTSCARVQLIFWHGC